MKRFFYGTAYLVLRGVINRTFVFRFSRKFPGFPFFRVLRNFFNPGKLPKKQFPVSRKSPASSQNIGQAHRVSRVRRVTNRHYTG